MNLLLHLPIYSSCAVSSVLSVMSLRLMCPLVLSSKCHFQQSSSSNSTIICRLPNSGLLPRAILGQSWASRHAFRDAKTAGRDLRTTVSSYASRADRRRCGVFTSLPPSFILWSGDGCKAGTTCSTKSRTSTTAWFAPSPRSVAVLRVSMGPSPPTHSETYETYCCWVWVSGGREGVLTHSHRMKCVPEQYCLLCTLQILGGSPVV